MVSKESLQGSGRDNASIGGGNQIGEDEEEVKEVRGKEKHTCENELRQVEKELIDGHDVGEAKCQRRKNV